MISGNFRRVIISKLVQKFGKKRPAEVERLVHEYLIFMWLRKLNPTQPITPSKLVDEVWHQHILFTREYAQFCQYRFGEFLHHKPTVSDYSKRTHSDDLRNYAQVLIRYEYHTKLVPPKDFWPTSDREKASVKSLQKTAKFVGGRVEFTNCYRAQVLSQSRAHREPQPSQHVLPKWVKKSKKRSNVKKK